MSETPTRLQPPEAVHTAELASPGAAEHFPHVPLPSTSSIPTFHSTSTLTPLVCDERAISRLLELILIRGGLSINEAARRLDVAPSSVRQYIRGRRKRPSLQWFIRLAELCGAKVVIEFPKGR